MGRAKPLSMAERGKITAFKKCGLSNREISHRLKRSSTVIDNFVKNLAKITIPKSLQVDLKY